MGLPLVVAGPEKDGALAEELRRRGARLEGYVETERLAELYRGAACVVQPSRFEGFGLPVIEAMASGTPVVVVRESALEEVAADAAVVVERDGLADGIRRRSVSVSGSSRPGSSVRELSAGAARPSGRWPCTGRYSAREGLRGRRLARARGRAQTLAARALPQVDEIVVVANTPGSVASVPEGVRVLENPRPLSLAANVNLGIAATSGEYVLNANPDAIPERSAVAELVAVAENHPRAGILGPQMRWPDGTWQPSRRRFPTIGGTIVRRTPLRRLRGTYAQRDHYLLDERPAEPVEADWMLGAFLLQRRTMLDELGGWDAGYRHYCEDIDLCYRAARAGWERWYVPAAVVAHDYAAVIDRDFLSRHTLWHLRGMARFVRKHPERLLAR